MFLMSDNSNDKYIGMVLFLNLDWSDETAKLLVGDIGSPTTHFSEDDKDQVRRAIFVWLLEHFETFKMLVDEWIDSGINADGNEEPWSRHLLDGTFVQDVMEEGEAVSLVRPESLIRRMFNAYQKKHPMVIHLRRNGGVDYSFAREGGNEDKSDPQSAVRLFMELFNSFWRNRLMRCARCRAYELVKTPRKSYMYGWHCAKCRNTGVSACSTKKSREAHTGDLLKYCAEEWVKDAPRSRDKEQWVLDQVNKRLAYGERIKRNFITRHLATIKAKALEMSQPRVSAKTISNTTKKRA
jgi:hypothetical protein